MFEILFILCVLTAFGTCLRILWLLIRRRTSAALVNLKWLVLSVVVYVGLVALVGWLSPQRIYEMGEVRCSDDWCISVAEARVVESIGDHAQRAGARYLLVTLQVSSRARGRVQSEPYTEVFLRDDRNRRFEVDQSAQEQFESTAGRQPPLGTPVEPGGAFTTVRVFDLPEGVSSVGLSLRQPGPGPFIIGDDASLLHKPAILRIPLTPTDRTSS